MNNAATAFVMELVTILVPRVVCVVIITVYDDRNGLLWICYNIEEGRIEMQ